MNEKPRDLNLLRDALLAKKTKAESQSPVSESVINALDAQVEMAPLSPQLKAAEAAFLKTGLACEIVSRGAGLEPYLKLKFEDKEVYVAHHYGHIVSTDRIPGFNTSTAGLGEFEYYVQIEGLTL